MTEADPGWQAMVFSMLFDDDIQSIRPNVMLTGTPLYNAIQGLTATRPNTIVLDPALVIQSFRGTALERDPRAVEELQAQLLTVSTTGGRAFIPILINNGHYLLAAANYAARTIRIYDSAPPAEPRAAALRIVARLIRPSTPPHEAPWDRRFAACPCQRNGADCGVSVVLTAVHLLAHPDAADVTALQRVGVRPVMPAMYWASGRAAILELIRDPATAQVPGAPNLLQGVERALFRDIASLRNNNRITEFHALAVVSNEIAALNENTGLLGNVVAMLTRVRREFMGQP